MAALLLVSACNDNVDIQQSYPFTYRNDACSEEIKRWVKPPKSGVSFTGTGGMRKQSISSVIPAGRGGNAENVRWTVLLPNDLYPLPGETFRLYYTSASTDQQTVDVYFQDSFGQLEQLTFSFNSNHEEEVN